MNPGLLGDKQESFLCATQPPRKRRRQKEGEDTHTQGERDREAERQGGCIFECQ